MVSVPPTAWKRINRTSSVAIPPRSPENRSSQSSILGSCCLVSQRRRRSLMDLLFHKRVDPSSLQKQVFSPHSNDRNRTMMMKSRDAFQALLLAGLLLSSPGFAV